jgi:ABC-type lipoprotein export system ATPase subunit
MSEEPLLELEGVTMCYDAPGRADAVAVLRDLALCVSRGDTVAITGPSGSGKSTLLNVAGGLTRPTSGKAVLAGRNLAELSDGDLASVRNREIGFVFQMHHLLPQCTVLENVLIPTLPMGLSRTDAATARERARSLLDKAGLADRAGYTPGRLSGGECQRVAVVRALINGPRLLLADEPTGSLDRAAADNIADLLVGLNRDAETALVVVSHSMRVARRMRRVYSLRDGRLVADESVDSDQA